MSKRRPPFWAKQVTDMSAGRYEAMSGTAWWRCTKCLCAYRWFTHLRADQLGTCMAVSPGCYGKAVLMSRQDVLEAAYVLGGLDAVYDLLDSSWT
jgi:hypothetical protein